MTRARDLSKILPNIETSGNFSVTGVSTVGLVTFTENVNFGDNDKLTLGDSSDLEIYHDGSNSYINDSGTGNLQLQTGGNTKFEILGYGVTVSGGLYVSGIATVGTGVSIPDDSLLSLGDDGDFRFTHSGNVNIIDTPTNRNIQIKAPQVLFRTPGNENLFLADQDGAVNLYYDNTKRIETTGAGATVTGDLNVTGFSTSLKTVTNSIIQKGTQWTSGETASLAWNNGSGNVAITTALLGGNVTFQVTGIPTGLSHANNVITLSVVIHQAAAARIVNVVTFNGENKVIHWSGSAAPTPNANKMDVFNFVGIDTRGTGAIADYFLIGNMNGNYGV